MQVRQRSKVLSLVVMAAVPLFSIGQTGLNQANEEGSANCCSSWTVTFTVPLKQLAFVGIDNKRHLEEGSFKVQVADQSAMLKVSKTIVF